VKCLVEVSINFTSEFDRGHGPLRLVTEILCATDCVMLLHNSYVSLLT